MLTDDLVQKWKFTGSSRPVPLRGLTKLYGKVQRRSCEYSSAEGEARGKARDAAIKGRIEPPFRRTLSPFLTQAAHVPSDQQGHFHRLLVV